jgi:hypothetical protein
MSLAAAALRELNPGLLEQIITEIIDHDKDHPDHGVGCACHDKHAGAIRRLMLDRGMSYKNWSNLNTVLCYVQRNPPILLK